MTDRQQQILYLRISARTLPLNRRTEELLASAFPNFSVATVDVQPLVRQFPLILILNGIATICHYGVELVSRKKRFRACFWRTPFIHRAISRIIRRKYRETDFAFTFQIQSLFDGSLPNTPHYVFTDHTHLANLSYPGFAASDLYSKAWIRAEKGIYHSATAVFTMSTNISASVINDYGVPPSCVTCIYSGPNIAVPEKPLTGEQRMARKILFVGVDWKRKGGDLLLDAFAQLRQHFPNTTLDFVGSAAPDDISQLPDGVKFHGKCPPTELARFFSTASIFCLPTRLEPFGIVFIEAMAYSLPIVATRIGAIPDLVEHDHNGLLVPPGDREALTIALTSLLKSEDRALAMGRAGRARYEDRFNWEAAFGKVASIIAQHTVSAGVKAPPLGNTFQ